MDQIRHWEIVSKDYRVIEDFFEFLWDKKIDLDFEYAKPGVPREFKRLLDEYFEVDRKKLDDERRDLIEAVRKFNKTTCTEE